MLHSVNFTLNQYKYNPSSKKFIFDLMSATRLKEFCMGEQKVGKVILQRNNYVNCQQIINMKGVKMAPYRVSPFSKKNKEKL